ncbi:MAG: M15 family metallopeptidase [Eubacteriaceae bacterium]
MRVKNKGRFLVNVSILILVLAFIIWVITTLISWVGNFFTPAKIIDEPNVVATKQVSNETAQSNDSLIKIVNKYQSVPEDYVPEDLITVEVDGIGSNLQMRTEAAHALKELFDAGKKEGFLLSASSGYRSYATQDALFDNNVKTLGMQEAEMVSARPGRSEHQLGLAMDITSEAVDFQLVEAFGETPEGIFLKNNAYKYGFIVRYPQGKTDITGYAYEPWHFRYVGLENAKMIFDSGKTMEEYFKIK